MAISVVLLVAHAPPPYFAGAQFVHVMLGPAVMAWAAAVAAPRELQRRGVALVLAALGGHGQRQCRRPGLGAGAAGRGVALAGAQNS